MWTKKLNVSAIHSKNFCYFSGSSYVTILHVGQDSTSNEVGKEKGKKMLMVRNVRLSSFIRNLLPRVLALVHYCALD